MSFDQFWTYRNVADAEGHAGFHVMYFIFLLTERRTRPAGNGGETQR